MSKLVIVLILALVAIVVAAAMKRRGGKQAGLPDEWPVFAKKVLSAPEQMLYQRLIRAFPDKIVLAQVALPSFLAVKKGANLQAWYNRFGRLYADFVLCEPDFWAIAVVELDDRSHDSPRRQDADARKAAVLHAVGIPLHRLNVNPLPRRTC